MVHTPAEWAQCPGEPRRGADGQELGPRGPDSATKQWRDGLEVRGQVRKEGAGAHLFFVGGQHSCV